MCNNENIVTIASAGGISPLIALLMSSSVREQEAASALANLSTNIENEVSIALAGGIPPLIALLRLSSVRVQEAAASALGSLGANDDNETAIAIGRRHSSSHRATRFSVDIGAGGCWSAAQSERE
jgi:HEAT repeat protein